MAVFVRIISQNFNLKKPKKHEENIFTIYSPKKATIERTNTLTLDTELSIKIPVTLLNESYFNKYHIIKGDVIG